MSKKQSFIAAVRDHFGQLTPLLDAELNAVTAAPFPEPAQFLLVEYDSPRFGDEFAVSLWMMDSAGEAVGEGHWFLKSQAVAVPAALYDAPQYAKIEPWSVAATLMQDWLIERWNHSVSQPLPAYLGHHDSYFKKNLLTGERIDWDSIIENASQ